MCLEVEAVECGTGQWSVMGITVFSQRNNNFVRVSEMRKSNICGLLIRYFFKLPCLHFPLIGSVSAML